MFPPQRALLVALGVFLAAGVVTPTGARGAEADLYVAVNGNDAWSGRLAEPNADGTDGPFVTIGRAQAVVRTARH